jgi:hypothetical protein
MDLLHQIEYFEDLIFNEYNSDQEDRYRIDLYSYLLENHDYIKNNNQYREYREKYLKNAYESMIICDNEELKEKYCEFIECFKDEETTKIFIKEILDKNILCNTTYNKMYYTAVIYIIINFNIDFAYKYQTFGTVLIKKSKEFLQELSEYEDSSLKSCLKYLIEQFLLEF